MIFKYLRLKKLTNVCIPVLALLALIMSSAVCAQTIQISGTVTDQETGETIAGANILQVGTNNGTATDMDGKYTISAPVGSTLRVTYVGYLTSEVKVPNQQNAVLNVQLIEDAQQMDEVVVVGYGTMRKVDVTGAIAVVKQEEILRTSPFNAIEGLKGVTPGVNVFINSGMPGESPRVVIRGQSSITAIAEPIYVVDGVVTSGFSSFNPAEVERMEVLKDASATSIYGARGSQGVILVTTTRGRTDDRTTVSYNGYFSLGQVPTRMDVMNSEEFMRTYKISMQNAVKYGTSTEAQMTAKWTGIAQNSALDDRYHNLFRINGTFNPEGWKDLNDNSLVPLYDTFWQDQVFQTAKRHSHSITIRSGGKTSSTGVFLNYTDEEGVLIHTWQKRMSGRITHDSKPLKWLSTQMSLNVNHTWLDNTERTSGGQSAIRTMIEMPPIFPVYWEDGSWTNSTNGINEFSFEALANPVHFLTVRRNESYNTRIQANTGFTIHLADGLDLIQSLAIQGRHSNDRNFQPKGVVNFDNSGRGSASQSSNHNIYWEERVQLQYSKVFDKHRVNATLLTEWSEAKNSSHESDASELPTQAYIFYNLNSGTYTPTVRSNFSRTSFHSIVGRVAYTLFDKYMATLTTRYDGCSRFGSNNKYGLFPALGLGWVVTEEKFMKNLTWMNHLKLHASYGIQGNADGIGNTATLATYSTGNVILNGERVSTGTPSLANAGLRWEKQKQFDIGFDMKTLKNRLNFEIGYYNKVSDDLLLSAPIPASSGFGSITTNIGSILNWGWEFMVTGVPVSKKDVQWETTVIANYNRSKLLKLTDVADEMFSGDNWVNARVIQRVGDPLGQWWSYERLGIITDPSQGRVGAALRSADQTVVGKGMPDWTGSWMNRFKYKNFDLLVDFQYTIGGSIRQDFFHSTEDRFGYTSGLRSILYDAWTEGKPGNVPNQVQAIRNAVFDGQDSMSDTRWFCSASYFRANTIQLGYNFTRSQAQTIGVSALRTYISVNNAFWVASKDFKGFDPEDSSRGRFEQNAFFFQYPKPRNFVLGLNVTF